jgi:hypothetical protein
VGSPSIETHSVKRPKEISDFVLLELVDCASDTSMEPIGMANPGNWIGDLLHRRWDSDELLNDGTQAAQCSNPNQGYDRNSKLVRLLSFSHFRRYTRLTLSSAEKIATGTARSVTGAP